VCELKHIFLLIVTLASILSVLILACFAAAAIAGSRKID